MSGQVYCFCHGFHGGGCPTNAYPQYRPDDHTDPVGDAREQEGRE